MDRKLPLAALNKRLGVFFISPNSAKVGGLQSQGGKGEAVAFLLRTIGNKGSGVLRLLQPLGNIKRYPALPEF